MGAFIATYFYNKSDNNTKPLENKEEEEEETTVSVNIDGINWVDPVDIPTIQYNVQPNNTYSTEAPKF